MGYRSVRNKPAAQQARQAKTQKRAVKSTGASWKASSFGIGGTSVSGYFSTDRRRLIGDPINGPDGTANLFLGMSLHQLARQLRHLERNNATVRSIVGGHRADIIGTGMTIRPKTGDDGLDAELVAAYDEHAKHIGAAGESAMELQRMWIGELDCAGNAMGRFVYIEDRIENGMLPVAVQPFEVEWLAPEPVQAVSGKNHFAAGIEYDQYGRPRWYHLRDPESGKSERVPHTDIIHAFERKRPRQAIGEPRLCAIIERGQQRGRLVDVELRSAINAAALTTALKTAGEPLDMLDDTYDATSDGSDGYITEVPPGSHANLAPGDELYALKQERPNLDVPAFANAINGDIAAAAEVSRVWLDRDGSQYNFANSRFDQIRSNMLTKPIQKWFGPVCAGLPYEMSLPFLMLRLGRAWPSDPRRQALLRRYVVQPDVPPEHDEEHAQKALAAGLANGSTSLEEYCSQRGKNWRDVVDELAEEQEYMREKGVVLQPKQNAPVPPQSQESDDV